MLGLRKVMDHGWIATLADDAGHQLSFLTRNAISLSDQWLNFPDCTVDTEGWIDDPVPCPVPLHVDIPAVVRDVLTHLPADVSPRDQLWLALENGLQLLHAPSVAPERWFRLGAPGSTRQRGD